MILTVILTIVHVIVCLFLVVVVLLQSGKAADLAGAFGGMGSQTVFGPRGAATALSRATTIAAVLFMVTSLGLSVIATRGGGGAGSGGSSVLEKVAEPAGAKPEAPKPTMEIVDPTSGKVVGSQPIDLDKIPKIDPAKPAEQKKQ
ncbi:MAG: preprotein translocase subunit SecG [Acidobacteria bacterium]|nr:preprotein translocase subunit SecG [Acidobacteriota bacterium]